MPQSNRGEIILYTKGEKGEKYYNDLVVIKTIAEQYSRSTLNKLKMTSYKPPYTPYGGNKSIHPQWSKLLEGNLSAAKTINRKREILKVIELLDNKVSRWYVKPKYKGKDQIEIIKKDHQGMKLIFLESSSMGPYSKAGHLWTKDFKFESWTSKIDAKDNMKWFRKLVRKYEGKKFKSLTTHTLEYPEIINYALIDGQYLSNGSYYFINEEGYKILKAFSKISQSSISSVIDTFPDAKSNEITPELVEAMAKFV